MPKGLCLVSFNDGLVEWKKLNADTYNNTHVDSWRFDLDYDEQGRLKESGVIPQEPEEDEADETEFDAEEEEQALKEDEVEDDARKAEDLSDSDDDGTDELDQL